MKNILPTEPLHWAGSALLAFFTMLFPADAIVYQAFAVLIFFDTLSGVIAAIKRRRFNSRTWRTKLLSKVLSYAIVPGALETFSLFLVGTGLESFFSLAAKFTLASIAFIELTSIFENTSMILGRRIALKVSPKELKDYMEANHLE